MKLTLPLSLARAMAFAAVTTRLLMGMFLDLPWLYNAAWLSALGAVLLCLPLGLLFDRLLRACPLAPASPRRWRNARGALSRGLCSRCFASSAFMRLPPRRACSAIPCAMWRWAEASAIFPAFAAFAGRYGLRLPEWTGRRRRGAHLAPPDACAFGDRAAVAIWQPAPGMADACPGAGHGSARLRRGERFRVALALLCDLALRPP